jgi:hypothetical protein
MIVFGEGHLRRILGRYATYYNESRVHRSLEMPHSIGRLSASASSHHSLFSAAFITNIAESDFRHAQDDDCPSICGSPADAATWRCAMLWMTRSAAVWRSRFWLASLSTSEVSSKSRKLCQNDPFSASSGIDTRVEEGLFFLSRRFAPGYAVRDGCCLSCFECHTESSSNRP